MVVGGGGEEEAGVRMTGVRIFGLEDVLARDTILADGAEKRGIDLDFSPAGFTQMAFVITATTETKRREEKI